MFCYQCEQTVGGKGCTRVGVCGKVPEIANMQDLLIYQLKGIACYAKNMLDNGKEVSECIPKFIEDCLFTTLTNVNFDSDVHINLLKKSQEIKEDLRKQVTDKIDREQATYNLSSTKSEMLKDAEKAGIMYDDKLNEDIRSLRSTILYGLKGISAYGHQARYIKYRSESVDEFYITALEALTDDSLTLQDLIDLSMKAGTASVEIMKVLDEANTTTYKNPSPQQVNVNRRKGPFIVISGHDLRDLEQLLQQTEGKGVNIYTHGEMLPAHGYPSLKKYSHLVGNFGTAWQNQQKEFDGIPGCILMTTNCLMKPKDSYKDRIFTTNVVGWEGLKYVPVKEDGTKDFSEVINKALELGGFTEDEEVKEITVGFGHNAVLSHANEIIEAVKGGKLRHIYVMGGCDGIKPARKYYTEFAQNVPKDCIILTLACGKYRFNKLDFGTLEGLPRLLDVGQCNDVYSAVKIALSLADAFNTDVNSLPLSIILSWYEQKAVADLLALLSLGVKGIHIGPSLPAFISSNVLQYLVDNFDIKPISTPEKDLEETLN